MSKKREYVDIDAGKGTIRLEDGKTLTVERMLRFTVADRELEVFVGTEYLELYNGKLWLSFRVSKSLALDAIARVISNTSLVTEKLGGDA